MNLEDGLTGVLMKAELHDNAMYCNKGADIFVRLSAGNNKGKGWGSNAVTGYSALEMPCRYKRP
ncbi:hypothetical protein D5281_04235 [bacterium 1xD42-62]|uniref:Uncharacterized protein n=1 Tax=Parablautia muri TaxID=2320879 RepID=A0A9X5BDL0_9FIRM|nr:hypothetical protein [Parablautia muri]